MDKTANLTLVSSWKCHGGEQKIYNHSSKKTKCTMAFSAFIPPHSKEDKFPVLYFLSGLTCTEKNFIEKSGFQIHAAKHKIIVIGPDTSPRKCFITGEEDHYNFGTGAGFYVDATEEKWKENYCMYSYVTEELVELVEKEFPTNGKMSIFGHSMGGHGALISFLRNPEMYVSVSAFAPICNPKECDWGKVAFKGYLGEDKATWSKYSSVDLVKTYEGPQVEVLIDQGTDDEFLEKGQLLPESLVEAAERTNVIIKLNMREGYDHSYYFIQTFIGNHIEFHAKKLASS